MAENKHSSVIMNRFTRHFLLWYGLLENFVFTGNIMGWTALHYMLREEGIYSDRCKGVGLGNLPKVLVNSSYWNTTLYSDLVTKGFFNVTAVPTSELYGRYVTCEEQDRILNLAYTVGSFCMGSTSFIWGFLIEKWGLRIVRLVINALLTTGYILLSLTKEDASFFLFPALMLMSLAGVPLRLANMEIADLFPSKRSTIITLYSGAFSASASVFVFIKYGFDYGLQWEWACFIFVVLTVVMLPVTLFLLPAYRVEEEKGLFSVSDKELSTLAPGVWGTFTYILDDEPFHKALAPRERAEIRRRSIEEIKAAKGEVKKAEAIPLRKTMLSTSFILHLYWFCWLLLYSIIYVGTLHLWLERMSSNLEQESFFSEMYGLFQVSGLFLAPIGGVFMDWSIRRATKDDVDAEQAMLRIIRSCFWPMMFTTLLETIVQASKFFNNTIAVYVSIVAVSLLRAFFLSIGTAYLRIRFPADHFNKLLGIMSTMSALVSILQFPLFIWESSAPENVLYVNIFYSMCLAVAFIHPLLLLVTPVQKYFLREKAQAVQNNG